MGGGREGLLPQAAAAILRHLSVVPRHRYMLSATYCGLTLGTDASVRDLLSPGAALLSVREAGAEAALSKLTQFAVECEDDVYMVMRRGRVMRSVGQPSGSAGDPLHAMLTLRLITRSSTGAERLHELSFVELVSPEVRVRAIQQLQGLRIGVQRHTSEGHHATH